MSAYATRADVYKYGLPRGVLGMPARLVDSVNASTDIIELEGHGFETDDQVMFSLAEGGTIPGGLAENTTYYAIRVSDSTFKVAATAAGAAINITSAGANIKAASPLPFDDVLTFYSRWVDTFLPAHVVPLATDGDGKYPALIVGIVAELAAKKLQYLCGQTAQSTTDFETAAMEQLKRFAAGIPVRDASQTPANKAVASSLVTLGTDSRGWGSEKLP